MTEFMNIDYRNKITLLGDFSGRVWKVIQNKIIGECGN